MKLHLSIFMYLAIAVFCPLVSSAQAHTNLPFSDKMTSENITCFAEDAEGYIWIGTDRGLNRYNGTIFEQFLQQEDSLSISNDDIFCMLSEDDGSLWIGTAGGINYHNIKRPGFTHVGIRRLNVVTAICNVDKDYLAYSDFDGIHILEKGTRTVVKSIEDRAYATSKNLLTTSIGEIWVVNSESTLIYTFDTSLGNFSEIPLPKGLKVSDITEIQGGKVILGTDKGLVCYNVYDHSRISSGTEADRICNSRNVLFVESMSQQEFVVGIEGLGMYHFSASSNVDRIAPQITLSAIKSYICFCDKARNLWIAQPGKSFAVLSMSRPVETNKISNAINDAHISQIGEIGSNIIWAKANNGSLLTFNLSTREPEQLTFVPSENPSFIFTDKDHYFVSITSDGFLKRHTLNGSTLKKNMEIRIDGAKFGWQSSDGDYIIVTQNSILKVTQNGVVSKMKDIDASSFRSINRKQSIGMSYFFTESKGIYTIDDSGEIGQIDFNIYDGGCIETDNNGNIWIGSLGNGLYKCNPTTKEVVNYTTSNGLKDNTITSIIKDNWGYIWIRSRSCISRYSPKTDSFTNYNDSNIIKENNLVASCCLKTSDGTLCFGGRGEIDFIFPHQQNAKGRNLPINLDALVVNDRAIPEAADGLVLESRQNNLTFYFSALDPVGGYLLNYAYQLKGYDKQIVFCGQNNSVSYSSLPSGKYTFEVDVQDSNGQWSEKPYSISFRIKQPLLLSPIMIVFYIIILAIGGITLTYTLKKWRENKRRLEEIEREKIISEQVDKTKIQLFGNISHELLTPLSLIYGPIKELSQKEGLSPHDKNLVRIAQSNAERMIQLTEQLLNFNREDQNTDKLKIQKIDLSSAMVSIVDNFSFLAKEKKLTLTHDIHDNISAYCDIEKIQKIVCNLISNALKYTPDGGHVFVSMTTDQTSTKITVSDTGEGIPKDKIDKIFDRYERLGKGKDKNVAKGFGIGLNYTLFLVETHKGKIDVKANSPKGTVFSFIFPSTKNAYSENEMLSEMDMIETSPYEEKISSEDNFSDTKTKDRTILIVEDNASLRSYLKDMFSRRFNVVTATDGEDAFDCIKITMPDMVISDVRMPRKDGVTLVREIKSSPEYCHIPVILLTANADTVSQINGLESGADAYVGKPFDPSYLRAVVNNIFTNRTRLQNVISSLTPATLESTLEEELKLSRKDRLLLEKVYACMDSHLDDETYNIESMASDLQMSRSSLYSKIKSLTGNSPQNFFGNYRMNKAMELLKTGEYNVSEVCYQIGFSSLAGFSRSFKKTFGVSPSSIVDQ